MKSHEVGKNGGVVYLTPKIHRASSSPKNGFLLEDAMHSTYTTAATHPTETKEVIHTISAGEHQPLQPAKSSGPSWSGWIETTGDALLIFEAARRGLISRITRPLNIVERKTITSGSVYVWDESQIMRWTDGIQWGPSCTLGNFRLYRSMNDINKNDTNHHDLAADSSIALAEHNPANVLGHSPADIGARLKRERILLDSLPNSYNYKADRLIKKTFSVKFGGITEHIICYYKHTDVESGHLRPPSSFPELAELIISPEYLDRTHFRKPPKVSVGSDGIMRYHGEADDDDDPPSPLAVSGTTDELQESMEEPMQLPSPVLSLMGSRSPALRRRLREQRLRLNERPTPPPRQQPTPPPQ
ncbi:hypothetical protein HYPSUDRAFT_412927 [Hypholoma sublateritium FD-334 SS-4]|uniref:Gti1/Pac2 family-domain-containing protein n=1 Tax=Hypholoma sublateritium (strain FD-334 SS-4) TaxID=945553 RepID=A0A0D2P2W1_HYPSF|nr:hypothetical protein HYPSUDRAFT_412927 [Hypholoma sublateritium FD-334 SS-4]